MQKNKIIVGLLLIIALGVGLIAFLQLEKHRETIRVKQQEQELIQKIEADMQKALNEPQRKIADGVGKFP